MAYIGAGVEYALHCLLWIAGPVQNAPSARELADFQGISPSFVAKIFSKLEKAGIVAASDGIRGGYRLARGAEAVTVLDVIDAVEGHKPLFDCQEIRFRCALYEGKPPAAATRGVCGIHAVMLQAEQTMRDALKLTTLAQLAAGFQARRLPSSVSGKVQEWFADRQTAREETRVAALRGRSKA